MRLGITFFCDENKPGHFPSQGELSVIISKKEVLSCTFWLIIYGLAYF